MRATLTCLAALSVAGLSACPAFAQVIYCAPALQRPLGYAPDACGPGFYIMNNQGALYGPSYFLRPPFGPETGIGPGSTQNCYPGQPYGNPGYCPPGRPPAYVGPGMPNPALLPHLGQQYGPQQANAAFPSHPFARSPRDFFMWSENMEDEMNRLRRPSLVP